MNSSKRRGPVLPTSPLSLLVLFLAFVHAASAFAVLGIDIGTKNLKATLVKPGTPLEIVLTKDSRRKQASAVGFKPIQSANIKQIPERLYGDEALAVQARFPGTVYPNIKGLLALTSTDDQIAKQYQKRYPALNLVKDNARDEIGFKSDSFGPEADFFSVEELLGMELKVIRENAELMAGKAHPITGAVISVPPFYTAEEKRAVEVAADLAGLKIMSFVSDGLAVGLHFATSRTFPDISKGEKPEHHLVFDMGAGSTTATLLKFQTRSLKDTGRRNKTVHEVSVVSTAWDKTLGGDAMTDLVVDDVISKFLASNAAKNADLTEQTIRNHGKSMAKIYKAAETVRGVLSANTATSSTINGLYSEDIDFNYKLNRADFETMASELAARAPVPIMKALEDAQLTMSELDAVILHGGAMRTPFVQKTLEGIVGDAKKLRTNVNSDEAAVFGAAFKAAAQSPSFRVKDITSIDIAAYSVGMSWEQDGKERRQNIFHPSDSVGAKKQVPFKNKDDFTVVFKQKTSHPQSEESVETPVTTSSLTNLTASVQELETKYSCKREDIKTSLSLQLSPVDALPEIVGGVVSCESEGPVKKPSGEGVVDNVKGFFGFGGKKDSSTDDTSSPSSSSSTEEASPSPSSKSKGKKKNSTDDNEGSAKKTYKINLSATTTRTGLSHPPAEEFAKMKSRLETFDQADLGRKLRDDLFNVLESTTYRTRDMLPDKSFIEASTSDQRQTIESMLSGLSEWLYSDGAHATTEVIQEKLTSLKQLVDPIQTRKEEASGRPALVKKIREGLDQGEKVVSLISLKVESASSQAATAAESVSSSASEAISSVLPGENEEDKTESASSSTITPEPAPTPESPWTMFSSDDVDKLKETLGEVKEWFVEKLAAQNKLKSSDDPALLVEDMESRVKILDNLGSDLFNRVDRAEKAASSSSSSASSRLKASASRASKSAEKAASAASASASSAAAAAAGETSSSTVTVDVTDQVVKEDPTSSSSADKEENTKTQHEEL